MRIIGGSLAGQVLKPPLSKWPTRPTTDRAREALYNILMNRIDFEEETFLDLFGGTGAHSIEFLSRGCRDVTYVDRFAKCASWVRSCSRQLSLEDSLTIVQADVAKYIKKKPRSFSIIFADPPYALPWLVDLPDMLFQNAILDQGGTLIIEHGTEISFMNHVHFQEARRYGQSSFSFFGIG